MTPYQSQTAFMFSLHVFLHVPLHVPRHDSLHVPLHVPRHVPLYVSLYGFLPNGLHVSPSWLPTKKVMQKGNAKAGKISIFSSLDAKLESLAGRVELTWFLVGSGRVGLKICSTRLESSWKCEQPDFKSSRIQNVNSKLNLTISLFEFLIQLIKQSKMTSRL